MTQIAPALRLAIALLACAAPLGASVRIVDADGGGDYATVQEAIDASFDRDVILLRATSFSATSATFPEELVIDDLILTIEVEADVPISVYKLTVRNLGPDRHVIVRGLTIDARRSGFGGAIPGHGDALVVEGSIGPVRLEACTLHAAEGDNKSPGFVDQAGSAAVSMANRSSVAFLRCTILGGQGASILDESTDFGPGPGGPGILADRSRVTLHECTVAGGDGGSLLDTVSFDGADGAPGVVNTGGRLWLSASTLTGGDGGNADCGGFPEVCGQGGDGAPGLHQTDDGGSTALQESELVGGLGGSDGEGGGTGANPHGSIVEGGVVDTHKVSFAEFSIASPLREGELGTVLVNPEPGDVMFSWVALETADNLVNSFSGIFLINPNAFAAFLGVGVAPEEGGPLALEFGAPIMSPVVDSLTVVTQLMLVRDGQTLLGGASFVTILDSSF